MASKAIEVRMKPCHPGEFIREEVLVPLDLAISKAAVILGVRRAVLSDLLNEKAALSPEMALRIEKAFGLDMDTLLRMQAWFDTTRMRERTSEFNVQRYEPEAGEDTFKLEVQSSDCCGPSQRPPKVEARRPAQSGHTHEDGISGPVDNPRVHVPPGLQPANHRHPRCL